MDGYRETGGNALMVCRWGAHASVARFLIGSNEAPYRMPAVADVLRITNALLQTRCTANAFSLLAPGNSQKAHQTRESG